MVHVQCSSGVLALDDVALLSAEGEGVLGRLLRTRGLEAPSSGQRSERQQDAETARIDVLVVEDEPIVLEAMQYTLERHGYRVATARNGEEAMIRFAQTAFAVVVTDLAMPGLSGLEVARRCKQARPGIAVVMVTAWDALLTDEDIAAHGVDRVLAKPVLGQTLLSAVAEVTRRS